MGSPMEYAWLYLQAVTEWLAEKSITIPFTPYQPMNYWLPVAFIVAMTIIMFVLSSRVTTPQEGAIFKVCAGFYYVLLIFFLVVLLFAGTVILSGATFA